jgi:hypothetical protein
MDSRASSFLVTLPAFTLARPDRNGLVHLLTPDNRRLLLLFTDRDNAETFRERAGLSQCPLVELTNSTAVTAFARGKFEPETGPRAGLVAVDPVWSAGERVYTLFTTEQVARNVLLPAAADSRRESGTVRR